MFSKIPKISGSFFLKKFSYPSFRRFEKFRIQILKILVSKFLNIRKIPDLILKIFAPKIPRILKVPDLIFKSFRT